MPSDPGSGISCPRTYVPVPGSARMWTHSFSATMLWGSGGASHFLIGQQHDGIGCPVIGHWIVSAVCAGWLACCGDGAGVVARSGWCKAGTHDRAIRTGRVVMIMAFLSLRL